jgi:hypothetical protein
MLAIDFHRWVGITPSVGNPLTEYGNMAWTPEKLSERARKVRASQLAKMTPEQRSEIAGKASRARWAEASENERQDETAKMRAAQTSEQLSANAKKANANRWAGKTQEERSAIARHAALAGAAKRRAAMEGGPSEAEKRRAYENARYSNDPDYKAKILAKNKAFAEDNSERLKPLRRAYHHQNKERLNEQSRKYGVEHRQKNAEAYRDKSRQHYLAYPDYYQVKARLRQASLKKASPQWLTKEQKAQIAAFYRAARDLTKATGELHVVDHIAPLQGKNSCGLHVPWNLQVITATENLKKNNREPPHG